MNRELSTEQRARITESISSGRKIEAIKELREISGLGLKDARDIIEGLERDLRAKDPTRFPAPASKSGCSSAVILALLGSAYLLFR